MLKTLQFPSMPISAPEISYFSKSENFSESKVILKVSEVGNGHYSLYHFQEDSLVDPYYTKSVSQLSSSPIQLCRIGFTCVVMSLCACGSCEHSVFCVSVVSQQCPQNSPRDWL